MNGNITRSVVSRVCASVALLLCGVTHAVADEDRREGRDVLVLTSTNDGAANSVVVFKLNTNGTPALSLVDFLPTGGAGGAGGNAGSLQFQGNLGAVANYGSNSVTQLIRSDGYITVGRTLALAPACNRPVSVALHADHLFAVGANCVESHRWPSGQVDGIVGIADASAAQVAAGQSWAAITLKSGSVMQLPLTANGALSGTGVPVSLPAGANDTPLGAAFWGDVLGFNPAHSADSLALVDRDRNVFPILGPQPAFPNGNAPCWLAKGPGNLWYSGNTPAKAISIFFSDGRGGAFYKSVGLPGAPTDITVSRDGRWLAVIYAADDGSGPRVAVFAIDAYGDLALEATSAPVGAASFNGVAISE